MCSGTEPLANKGKQPPILQFLEEQISLKGPLVDNHRHSDLELCGQRLYEHQHAGSGHAVIIAQ